jgi:hypothetical protein
MAKLILNGSTSGSVTLDVPAVAGTTTLTLPTTSGTVLTNGTNTNFPAGSVLQVVQGTTATAVSSSSNVLADTGLTATITPKSATSKILVIVSQNGCDRSGANSDSGITLRLYRNATDLHIFTVALGYTATTLRQIQSASTCYLDSPATTSATTYKTAFQCWNSSVASISVNANGVTSTITLLEIAA